MSPRPRPFARTILAAQSDERLVRLLREGHEQAFDEIVRRYRGSLVAFATAIAGHGRAEDAVQAALVNAHVALLADDREVTLRPWLFTIVRNRSLNLIRSEPANAMLDPRLPSPGPDGDPELVAERNEELDRLVSAICALPSAQREALVRRELEGIGHGEIAAQLDTTAAAVRGLIFRARTQVRNAIGALVPLPLLRTVLAQGSAAGAAGGGAAILGGAGAKGGIAAAAAVLALGTGIAIHQRHGGNGGDGDAAVAKAAQPSQGSSRDGRRDASPPSPAGARDDGADPGRADRDSEGDRRSDAGNQRSPSGEDAPPGPSPAPSAGPSAGGGSSGDDDGPAGGGFPSGSDDGPSDHGSDPGPDDSTVEVEDPEPVEAPDDSGDGPDQPEDHDVEDE